MLVNFSQKKCDYMVKFPDISERDLIIILLIIVIMPNLIGFLMFSYSYISNFLAEVSGVFTGIIIGLVLVKRFNQIQRKKQWKKVETLTFDSLTIYLEEFYGETFMNFNYSGMDVSPTTPKWKDIDQESVDALGKWINDLVINRDDIVDPKKERLSDRVVEWYDAINDSLLVIRTVLFPRILEISEDNELINALIEFDSEMMELYIVMKGYKEMYHVDLFPNFIKVLNKIRNIYMLLLKRKS